MILFWLICAALVAIALAFILPTLLQRGAAEKFEATNQEANVEVYRDQLAELDAERAQDIISPEQYQQDRNEIERRLLTDVPTTPDSDDRKPQHVVENRVPVYAIAFGIPLVAVVLYLVLGNSAALSGVPASTGPQASGPMTQAGIEANVAALAKRLEQNPNDAQGWTMLARSYLNLEKYNEAAPAYARATTLNANDVDLLIEYAFVLAMTNNRQLAGQPRELINRALQIAPENARAIELAGSAEFQARNYKEAIRYWQQLLPKLPADSELARSVTERIKEAESLAANPR